MRNEFNTTIRKVSSLSFKQHSLSSMVSEVACDLGVRSLFQRRAGGGNIVAPPPVRNREPKTPCQTHPSSGAAQNREYNDDYQQCYHSQD